jgi:hypothetical protein
MTIRQLSALSLGGLLLATAPAAWSHQAEPGQDKPEARQQARAAVKAEPSSAVRKASGLQEPKKDAQQDRRERAAQVSGNLQKKANETASAVASNMK